MKIKFIAIIGALTLLTSVGTTTLNAQSTQKSKPFLIQGKLPHLTMMIKTLWNDKDLALTPIQKEKLLKIRKRTITDVKSLSKQINNLETRIVKESNHGIKPKSLKPDVEKLAHLRAKATMIHLKCIYDTRSILSKDQLYILE